MPVQSQTLAAAPSGTTLRIEIAADQSGQRAIIATASATGDQPRIHIGCSGTNRLVAADGQSGCSASQIFAFDAGFAPWVEVTVEGPGRGYDLALSVTTASS